MKRFYIIFLLTAFIFYSCSHKHHPAKTPETTAPVIVNKDSVAVKKNIRVRKKTPPAKVIIVNDAVAKTSVDGRLYYDLEGHRYWKNYKDGKYYIFNQSMYNNLAFKKPE